MRSKVLSYLLSFSLIFCVGFGSSLTASAADFFYNQESFSSPIIIYIDGSSVGSYTSANSYNVYHFSNGAKEIASNLHFIFESSWDLQFDFNDYDYYLYSVVDAATYTGFIPSSVQISDFDNTGTRRYIDLIDPVFTAYNGRFETDNTYGFSCLAKLPDDYYRPIASLRFNGSGNLSSKIDLTICCIQVLKGSDSNDLQSIIAAINSASDDIQQSIEDQYGGDPGSSFPVDDIITQHNEKMGVLSFGSDTLMQVLGLLSPDQSLSSELVFPSMSLTIAGQRNKVQLWPEYRFDLNELKQHWPNFVGLMQSLTTALVWIFVLRYCYRVFEKYFLAGGGN